jgi:tetratricopeptide (TPR) repeat protein
VQANRGKRSPSIARLHLEAGRAHLMLDDLVEALEALKVALNMDPRSVEIGLLLGLVALDLDDERTAERVFLALAAKVPQTEGERQAQATAYSHLASMAFMKGELPKARRLLGKALAAEADHPAALALQERLGGAGAPSLRG